MGALFKIGDVVEQKMPAPITGVVKSLEFNGNDIQYTIEYPDADGGFHEQPFTENELTAGKVA
jgi:hypothetical protein